MIYLKEYIKSNTLIVDGAMGTYYQQITNELTASELANISTPEVIGDIHKAYVEAGAMLVRTNTFHAYSSHLGISMDESAKLAVSGYEIAKEAVGTKAYIGCSIGPLFTNDEDESTIRKDYLNTIDALLGVGADTFFFETFDDTYWIEILSEYILNENPDASIIASVTINSYGYTKTGTHFSKILDAFKSLEYLVAYGFNCTIGAGHMKALLKGIDIPEKLLAMPNAGYPELYLNRQSYRDNSSYFGEQMYDIHQLGVNIVGACCGTTPEHIRQIRLKVKSLNLVKASEHIIESDTEERHISTNAFMDKLDKGEFVVTVELDPPFKPNISKLMDSANIIKNTSSDLITLADSPLGRTRVDAMMMAAKIKREVGIDVMPHLCCRDKNTIAIRSTIMAGYIEGIRNVLCVTGDPVPSGDKGSIKAVFNVNAIQLMGLVGAMNKEQFQSEAMLIGGAFDPKRKNMDREIERIKKKKEAGAKVLFTQPIYDEKDLAVIKRVKEETGIKVLAGILPLVSYKNARFIDNEFPGMSIPDYVLNQFKPDMSRAEAQDVGVKTAVEVINTIKEGVDGLYLMTPFNRATMIKEILDRVGI